MKKKRKVLIVDDEEGVLNFLKNTFYSEDYQVSTALNLNKAEELVKKENGKIPFNVVLMDANFPIVGPEGINKAKELKQRFPKMIVIIMSGYPGLFQDNEIPVDACLVKPFLRVPLLEVVESLVLESSKRFKLIEKNLLSKIKEKIKDKNLLLLNKFLGENFEGFEGKTVDKLMLRWTAYRLSEHIPRFPSRFFSIGISASKGCDGGCFNCLSQENGIVRELETEEMLSQIYYGLKGYLAYRALRESLGKKEKITVAINSTCGGDWMHVPTPRKTLDAFWEIYKLEDIHVRFILTSTGDIKVLEWLIDDREARKFLWKMRIELYFSLNYPFQAERDERMKNTAGQDIRKLVRLHHHVALITGRKNTVSYVLSKGINDSKEHAYALADLLHDRERGLKIKLQGAENKKKLKPSTEELLRFQGWILERNPKIEVRARGIIGGDKFFGCGSTVSTMGKLPKE